MTSIFDREVPIHSAFHEVLGRHQSLGGLAAIAGVTGLAAVVWGLVALPQFDVAVWRGILAALLMLDIAAGAVANFTSGTSGFYAQRPVWRWGFIAIHIHLPVIGLLLSLPLMPLLLIWAYTIVGAGLVNLCFHKPWQPVIAGALLCVGLLCLPHLPLTPWVMSVALLFMTKVLFAFAVNHYQQREGTK